MPAFRRCELIPHGVMSIFLSKELVFVYEKPKVFIQKLSIIISSVQSHKRQRVSFS